MILQDEKNGCGAAALTNALRAIGQQLPQDAARKLAGTSHEGTTDRGMVKALRTLGHVPCTLRESNAGVAWVTLRGHLAEGHPVLLAVDDWDHWIVAIGILGDRVILVDSADGSVVQVLDIANTLLRWQYPGATKGFYGIAVVPGEGV